MQCDGYRRPRAFAGQVARCVVRSLTWHADRPAGHGLVRMAACLAVCLFLSMPVASLSARTNPLPEASARQDSARQDSARQDSARQDSTWTGQSTRPDVSGLVFVTQQYPPFNYLERGEGTERVGGPVAEIITMACARMGVGCTFRLLPWARAQQEVRSGAADGIFTIGFVPERQQWLHFCPPLLRVEYGFFVRMENPLHYVTPRDVTGYRVGGYGPSLTSDILGQLARQVPMTVDVAPDNDAGFLKLAQGRIDAVFSNRENGLATIALLRIANLRYAGWHSRVDYTVAFSRQTAPEVVEAFEAALRELHREGELQRCLARYGLQSTYPDVQDGKDSEGTRGRPRGEGPAGANPVATSG
ncbi:transporter substrate-binding domain-containing protein [Nitratidesulfovibrio liaohensis]|uniref:Transporter substrate-binding domain-containing protein n=1 Tax=Nitratidesulfovibrio liaohensis TaxID=2604158 RepID=A0ABY9R4S7_9BACT|nr:transporter substrate-binding domain-containing protein [Nitratidesulfovibrio liaohensis]WMW66756.1 transporter substrate-binding domain-containing protein [Nitratidesulfovibrio liaohensis]